MTNRYFLTLLMFLIILTNVSSQEFSLNQVISYYSNDNIYPAQTNIIGAEKYNSSHTFLVLKENPTTLNIDLNNFDINLSSNSEIYMIVFDNTQQDIFDFNLDYKDAIPSLFSYRDIISPKGYKITENKQLTFSLNQDINDASFILYQKTKDSLKLSYFTVLNVSKSEAYKYNLFQLNKEILKFYCYTCQVPDAGENLLILNKFNKLYFTETISNDSYLQSCLDPYNELNNYGKTGQNSYSKYGLNNLYFSWKEEDITSSLFDYGAYYVDPDQLKISLSKKLELLKDPNNYINLNDVYFQKDAYNQSIIDSYTYLDLNLELDLNYTSSKLSISDSLVYIEQVISSIPESITKRTILYAVVDGNADDFDLFFAKSVLDSNKFTSNNFMTKETYALNFDYEYESVGDENVEAIGTLEGMITRYEIPIYTLLEKYSEIKNYALASIYDSNSTNVLSSLLSGFNLDYSTNKIYLGTTLNDSIINVKSFGDLEYGITKNIFEKSAFLTNDWKLSIDFNGLTTIDYPQTVILNLSNINYEKRTATITFVKDSQINDYLNIYQNDLLYKNNLLFRTLINASYFNYGGIPFTSNNGNINLVNASASLYTNYTNLSRIQEGFIFKITDTNGTLDYSYADLRPILFTSSIPTSSKINYLINLYPYLEYIPSDNNISSKNKIFFNLTNWNYPFEMDYSSDIYYQAYIDSKIPLYLSIQNYNLAESKKNNYRYEIPINLSLEPSFFGINTINVDALLSGVMDNKICFRAEPNSLKFWINPDVLITDYNLDSYLDNSDGIIIPDIEPRYGDSFNPDVSEEDDELNSKKANVLFEMKDMASIEKYHLLYKDLYNRAKLDLNLPDKFKSKINLTLDEQEMLATLDYLNAYQRKYKDKIVFNSYLKNQVKMDPLLMSTEMDNETGILNASANLKYNSLDVIYAGLKYKDKNGYLILNSNTYTFTIDNNVFNYLSRPNSTRLDVKNSLSNNLVKNYWKNIDKGNCASFAVASAQFLFKFKYISNDAGCLRTNNSTLWCYNKGIKCINPIMDLKRKRLLVTDLDNIIPGSILGVYLPNGDISRQSCTNPKANYTHVALYLGKINGVHYGMDNWAGTYRVGPVDSLYMSRGYQVREVILPPDYIDFLDSYYDYLLHNKLQPLSNADIKRIEKEKLDSMAKSVEDPGVIESVIEWFKDVFNFN